jgi:hypothetical protein
MCEVPDFSFGSYAEDSKTFTVYSKTFLIWSARDQKLGFDLSSLSPPQCYVVHWTPEVVLNGVIFLA